MFENYVGAKTRPARPWVIPLFFGATGLVGMGVLALVGYQLLALPMLEPPDTALAMAAPPAAPPPPPPGAKAKPQKTPEPKLRKVKDTVQPDREREIPEATERETEGIEGGVFGGVEGGKEGGVVGAIGDDLLGSGLENGDSPPPPPPAAPKLVLPHALEAQRIAGDARIVPADPVKLAIDRQGISAVFVVVKMCLSPGGKVSSLELLKSSGFPGYDRAIVSRMRGWRYRPFRVNGKAVPVCTSVTFRYRQSQ